MKVLGTGLSGLVGSRVVELLQNKYEFENISLSTGIDITNRDQVIQKIKSSEAPVVIHFAAKTDVDECEQDKEEDKKMFLETNIPVYQYIGHKKTAWVVNVIGIKNIVDACQASGKKLIYISTDFVFNGEDAPANGYKEEDVPDPINWYGETKYQGEKIVQDLNTSWIIARIAYPYRSFFKRTDFVRSIIDKFRQGENLAAITDHIMVPTFIDDIVKALDFFIKNEKQGIFHVVGSQALSPHEAALLISRIFGFDSSIVTKIGRDKYFANRAPRPFRLELRNDKIEQLGVEMKTFEMGLQEVKKQIENL